MAYKKIDSKAISTFLRLFNAKSIYNEIKKNFKLKKKKKKKKKYHILNLYLHFFLCS